MPEKKTAAKKTATKAPAPKKGAAPKKGVAPKKAKSANAVAKERRPAVDGSGTPPRSASVGPSASEARLACPRCGTDKFAPEQRIRAEGSRTVRYTVLVCERGHTFAKPRPR